jgi:sterol 3beta-glucosyltransferase
MRHTELPEFVFPVESVPHEWLFPRVAAAVHHGGAGTTAAALRAGIPSVVVPYFYDQLFWGLRLHKLGVAPRPVAQKHLTSDGLAAAIQSVVGSPEVGIRSREIAARIANERGVEKAVAVVERYLSESTRRVSQ